MPQAVNRRNFLKIAGFGGVVFASGLARGADSYQAGEEEFFFVQLSDTHWGFQGPAVNPESATTLPRVVKAIAEAPLKPDFVVFTGDLTHTTDDEAVRRKRMGEFKEIVSGLKSLDVKFIPGEHDASLDEGKAFREAFGAPRGSFDHKGIHFLMLDNVSDPGASVGDEQIAWMRSDLEKVDKEKPVVVFAHRPLFDLYPQWDWSTKDGAKVVEALSAHEYVTVFYGHIHQEHHQMTGHIPHHAAKGLMFPLPAPHSVPKKAPIPWDAAAPYRGLGFRTVQTKGGGNDVTLTELAVEKA
jgi:predicted phosphodiesterase